MAVGVSNRDGGKTDEAGHTRLALKAWTGNVLSGLQVIQRAAGANMSVDITSGDGKISSGTGYDYGIFNDTSGGTGANVTITTANVSNPRRDIIVAYIDLGQARSTAVSNNTNGVLKFAAVAGTAAGSPSDPSDGTIQSAVGSGNPFIKLGRVTVAAAATSITSGMITDLRTFMSPTIQNGGLSTVTLFTPYKFHVARTGSNQSIGEGVATKVQFNTELLDTGSNFDNATNYRFTAPVTGFYQFNWSVSVINSGSATCLTELWKNGAEFKRGSRAQFTGGSTFESTGSPSVPLTAGDYVEVYAFGQGSPIIEGAANTAWFSGYLVSI